MMERTDSVGVRILVAFAVAIVAMALMCGLSGTEAHAAGITRAKITSFKEVPYCNAKIKWNKVKKAKGYQVAIADNKKFTLNKQVWKTKRKSFTITNIPVKLTFYAKVRAYTAGKRYGKWSKIKKLKVKGIHEHEYVPGDSYDFYMNKYQYHIARYESYEQQYNRVKNSGGPSWQAAATSRIYRETTYREKRAEQREKLSELRLLMDENKQQADMYLELANHDMYCSICGKQR